MVGAIASHHLWLLNFTHVFSSLLWTGIDLVHGLRAWTDLRVIDLSARKAVLLRLTARTLFDADPLHHQRHHWLVSADAMGFTA